MRSVARNPRGLLAPAAAAAAAALLLAASAPANAGLSTPAEYQQFNDLVIDTNVCCEYDDQFLYEGMAEIRVAFHWNVSAWDNPPYKARLTFVRAGTVVGSYTGDVLQNLGLGSFGVPFDQPLSAADLAVDAAWEMYVYIVGGVTDPSTDMIWSNRVASDVRYHFAPTTTASPVTTEPTPEPTTAQPTTANPTTAQPTTSQPTTAEPTTAEPTAAAPTPPPPTTEGDADGPADRAGGYVGGWTGPVGEAGKSEGGKGGGKGGGHAAHGGIFGEIGMGKKGGEGGSGKGGGKGGKGGGESGHKSAALEGYTAAAARRKPTSASLTAGLGFLLIATVGTLVVLYRKHASSSSSSEEEQEYFEYQSPRGIRSPCREGQQFITIDGEMQVSPNRPGSQVSDQDNSPFGMIMRSYGNSYGTMPTLY